MLLGSMRDRIADDPSRRSQLQPARQAPHGAKRAIVQAIALRAAAFLAGCCRGPRQRTKGSHRPVLPSGRSLVKRKMLLKARASVENCPLCRAAEIGKAGGMATAKKYGSVQLSRWGAKGGRPKKKKPGTRKKS